MPDTLTEAAPAKINLYLHVTGRRPDGYHLLDSLAVFAAGDVLTASPADELSLEIAGPFAAALDGEADNLVLRAARALAAEAGVAPRARLRLEKRLPVASGIGGGSADAAATLRLLQRMWQVPAASAALATRLGADVPVCLVSRPCHMRGIGEHLRPVEAMQACGLVLVNPGVPLATADVFRARRGDVSPEVELPDAWPSVAALVRDLAPLRNDLQQAATALQPVIGEVLAVLAGTRDCLLARMSGSGASCFGLFADASIAASAAIALQRPGWWCWGGALPGFTSDGARPMHASTDGA